MAKTKISEFDSNPANNTDIDGINLAEGMAPGLVNNAIRELMAQLKDFQQGTTTDYNPFLLLAKQAIYPVGSVYINASDATNPGTLLGFGTWEEIGSGRVLVGQDTGDSSFNSLGETGGSKDAVLVSHDHGAATGNNSANHTHTVTTTVTVENAGSHNHGITDPGHLHEVDAWLGAAAPGQGGGGDAGQRLSSLTAVNSDSVTTGITIDNDGTHNHPATVSTTVGDNSVNHNHSITAEGVSGTNANLQPYVVVKMWKRTA